MIKREDFLRFLLHPLTQGSVFEWYHRAYVVGIGKLKKNPPRKSASLFSKARIGSVAGA